jgi:hypothetical protein
MGYRLTSNTWRAPIQLIDCWLPVPTESAPPRQASRVVQLFTRAGWLNRPAASVQSRAPQRPAPGAVALTAASSAPATHRPCHVRVLRNPEPGNGCRPDARLVISGRMSDVCAELDRLASLELRLPQPQ